MKKLSIFIIFFSLLVACNTPKKNSPIVTESKKGVISEIQPAIEITRKAVDSIKISSNETITDIGINNKKGTEILTKIASKTIENKAVKIVKNEAVKIKDVIPAKKELLDSAITKVVETKTKQLTKEETTHELPLKPSHKIWNDLTKSYVSKNGKVNYGAFKTNISQLESYLKMLETTPPTINWSRNEKLAYWFNLYNAATVYLVATNYPVNSIKDINNGKPWDKKFIQSGSQTYSLNEIENTVVRPNYNEPRLHVAFNCAAVSCPNLLNEAFMPDKLNKQLSTLTTLWIGDSSKNNLSNPNKIQISQIFNWYIVDFKEGIIPFINQNSTQPVSADAEISFLDYNWKLNN